MALWVFGYGSLVWRPAFAFVRSEMGFIEGWSRRFWQGSTDHRGVPGSPGRVVTLTRVEGARCWGMAYEVEPSMNEHVLAKLDHREQGGYDRLSLPVSLANGGRVDSALLYVATEENPNYLGPASPQEIAAQVRRSSGPSGPNDEYVLRLAAALREGGVTDPHVFEVEEALTALERESEH